MFWNRKSKTESTGFRNYAVISEPFRTPKPENCEHEYVILEKETSKHLDNLEQVHMFCPKCKGERCLLYCRAKNEVKKCQLRQAYLQTYKTHDQEIEILKEKVASLEAHKEDWSDF